MTSLINSLLTDKEWENLTVDIKIAAAENNKRDDFIYTLKKMMTNLLKTVLT